MRVLCLCASVIVAAAQPHLLVDLKDQALFFFPKLLLKNQGGMLYPFSEKPLLIPVSRITSCEVWQEEGGTAKTFALKVDGYKRAGNLRMEAVDATFHLS